MPNFEEVKNDIMFLLSFAPAQDPDDVVAGLCPTFYITNTYEGDVKLAQLIMDIKNKYGIVHEAGVEESIS